MTGHCPANPVAANEGSAKKGSGPNRRNDPKGASHDWGLTPFLILLCFFAFCPSLFAEPVDADRDRQDLPDPFLDIWDRAVAAMDRTYGDWNRHADQSVESTEFAIEFLASITPDSPRRLDTTVLMQADQNRDKWVSRDESMRFLEIQLGIRWETDDLLRRVDGRVVDFDKFISLDTNRDSKLSSDEIDSATSKVLVTLDQDADEVISLSEFSHHSSPFLRDPVDAFHAADANSNNRLDFDELMQASPKNRQHLIGPNLAAFDEDQDQQLSLTEYRVSMLGNYNYRWHAIPIDDNRDRRLSFDEFRFHGRSLFQLQRRFYFHRLDLDRDGVLALNEFPFETVKIRSLVRISVDDKQQTSIFSDDSYPRCGSPDVSPDGRSILFDAGPMQPSNQSVIRIMTMDGLDARDVCDGVMPTWSADGHRFACSRYDGDASVWIMRLDGSVEKRIDNGWGAQWSPDGKSIAYAKNNGLLVYDVNEGTTSIVLASGIHPYRFISGNLAWSPDSNCLVFKGKLDDQQSEVAILDVASGKLSQKLRTSMEIGDDFAWLPDGATILFPWFSEEHGRSLIYRMNVDSNDSPTIDSIVPQSQPWTSVCVTTDGKSLILATDAPEASSSSDQESIR